MSSDLTSPQVRALSELLDSINYERQSLADSGKRGIYTDFLEKDGDMIRMGELHRLSDYYSPEGWLRTPIGKPEELGAIKGMQRYGNVPPEGKIIGVEGDVVNVRSPSLEELIAQVQSGNALFRTPILYTPSIQPTAISSSLLQSLAWGDPLRGAEAAMVDPSISVATNWNTEKALVPTQYDPRYFQHMVATQERRMQHFEALFNKLRGTATPEDLANIWTDPYGHSDLALNVPTTAGEALKRLDEETKIRNRLLELGTEREQQYKRQVEVQIKRILDPSFNTEYEKAIQAGRDARRFIGSIPSAYIGELSMIGGNTDEVALRAFEGLPEKQQAGILPSLEAIAAYNRVLDAEGLRKGLLKIPDFNETSFSGSPRVKGGYLGINFGPQMEAAYDAWQKRAGEDLSRRLDRGGYNLDVVKRYYTDPSTRPVVNQQVGSMAKNAVGALGLAAYAGGIVQDAPSTIVAAGIPFTRFTGVGPVLEAGGGEERALYNIRAYGNPHGPEPERAPINNAYLDYIYNFGGGM